jgi:AcrR family transcriptional regulator
MVRPKRTQQVNLEDAITTTAWRQIAEAGAAALSLRAIARELGITAPAIYNHFPSRDDLVTALIKDAFTSFAEALESARDALPFDDHAGRLRAICQAYREWALTNPQKYVLIFGTPISGYKMDPEASLTSQRSFLVLMAVIGEGYQSGKYRLADSYVALSPDLQARYEALGRMGMPYSPIVTQMALETWSWIHGLASLELYGYLTGFLADQVGEFVRLEMDRYLQAFGLE